MRRDQRAVVVLVSNSSPSFQSEHAWVLATSRMNMCRRDRSGIEVGQKWDRTGPRMHHILMTPVALVTRRRGPSSNGQAVCALISYDELPLDHVCGTRDASDSYTSVAIMKEYLDSGLL